MSYEEYLERYTGAEPVPEREFGFYCEKAGRLIDSFTFGRGSESELEEVAYAQAELIQYLYENSGRRGVVSESNDGLSVTYADGGSEVSDARDIVKQWLGGTGLMYAGVEMGESCDGGY